MADKFNYRIVVFRGDIEFDVTEAVTDTFDIATCSMDFGSGFLDTEELANLQKVALALGVDTDEIDSMLERQMKGTGRG